MSCLGVITAKFPFVFLTTTYAKVCGTTKLDGVPFCIDNDKLVVGVMLSPLFVFKFKVKAGKTTYTA